MRRGAIPACWARKRELQVIERRRFLEIAGFSARGGKISPPVHGCCYAAANTPNPWPEAREPGNQVVGANFAVIPRDALLFQREPVS
jgi:hypothetical protein